MLIIYLGFFFFFVFLLYSVIDWLIVEDLKRPLVLKNVGSVLVIENRKLPAGEFGPECPGNDWKSLLHYVCAWCTNFYNYCRHL